MSEPARGVNPNSWLMLTEELKGHHKYQKIPMEIPENPRVSSTSPGGMVPTHFLQLDSKFSVQGVESGKRSRLSCRAYAFLSATLGTFGIRVRQSHWTQEKSILAVNSPACRTLQQRGILLLSSKSLTFLQPMGSVCHFSVYKGWFESPLELDVLSEGKMVGEESCISPHTVGDPCPSRLAHTIPPGFPRLSQVPVPIWLTRWPMVFSGR